MQRRIAQVAEIRHAHAKTRQRVGHDRPVAAKLGELVHQLDIRALARRGRQSRGKLRDRRQPLKCLRAVALVHDVDDLIHESVQADKRCQLARAIFRRQQFFCATFA